ncbi:MAG: carbon monoxide dehydrogenase subunit G [Acetobacteraceae bacterium]|nr:carbon monoxide dehydrogenase subunit G [Acetobacteraceae bacterium]
MSDTRELRIAAPRAAVWQALHDVEVLRRCLPNCEQLEWRSEHQLDATFRVRLGPLNARLKGTIELSRIEPLEGYTISGRFEGAMTGFAEGACDVRLAEQGAETELRYDIRSSVGGKLARIASRLTEGSAARLAERFFARFEAIMAER